MLPNTPMGQIVPGKIACVVPVAADQALAWCSGALDDIDLLTKAPLVPEGVFIVDLPDRKSYRVALERIYYWHLRGACFMICRTGTPVVDHHMLEKNPGCVRTFTEDTDPVKHRYMCPPAPFANWVTKWGAAPLKNLVAGKLEAIP